MSTGRGAKDNTDGMKQALFSSHKGLGPPILQLGSQFLLLPFNL